jgi:hypothetical protein
MEKGDAMSTPPDQPTNENPQQQAAEPQPAAPQAAAPQAPPPVPAPPPPVAPAAAPPAFAPVLREPWINPGRRTQVAALGFVAALACLGAGIGIGFAVSGGDHRNRPHGVVILPRHGFGYGPGGYGPMGRFPMPGGPYGNGGGSAASSPAPSSTG